MTLAFPANPSVGDIYPIDPGTSGVTQYQWDGEKWTAILSTVSLGTANQRAFNDYTWPTNVGVAGQKLTLGPDNTLSWGAFVEPLSLSQAFTPIAPQVGVPVIYAPGSASGGSGGYTFTYQWAANGINITGATTPSYTPTANDVGKVLSVTQTVTDSSGTIVSQVTSPPGAVPSPVFPLSLWNPLPSEGLNEVPGLASGVYNDTGTIVADGCLEASVNGGAYQTGSQAIVSGQTLAIRWANTALCGLAATGTVITGTIRNGTYTNTYSLEINRVPTGPFNDIVKTEVSLSATVEATVTPTIQGINAPAYVTYASSSTAANIHASRDGVNFQSLRTSGTNFVINNGETLYLSQIASATPGGNAKAVIRIGDGTNVPDTFTEFDFLTVTTTNPVFSNTVFSPTQGPTASPSSVDIPSQGLFGTANGVWADGQTTIFTTGALQFSVNGGDFGVDPLPVANEDNIALIWDTTAVANASNGSTITGTLTNGILSNEYSFVIDSTPAFFSFMNREDEPLSSTVLSNVVVPTGYNVPATVAAPTGTLTSLLRSIQGGGFTNGVGTIIPGWSIQLRGNTGNANATTYTGTISIGGQSTTWGVTTTDVPASITTPMISSPLNGAIDVNPAFENPQGLTLTGTSYEPQNGAGSQTSSEWEVFENSFPLTSTNTITGVAKLASGSFSDPVGPQAGASGNVEGSLIFTDNSTFAYATYIDRDGSGTGCLSYTNNGGVTWNFFTFGGGLLWEDVCLISSTTWLLGNQASGSSWQILGTTSTARSNFFGPGPSRGLASADIAGNNLYRVVVGSNRPDTYYVNNTTTSNFQIITNLPAGLPLNPASPVWDESSSKFLIIGRGICIESTDGINWIRTPSVPDAVFDLGKPVASNGTILIGEEVTNGRIYRSTDAGASWTEIDTGVQGCIFTGNRFTTDGAGKWWFTVPETDTLGFSEDDGVTWSTVTVVCDGSRQYASTDAISVLPGTGSLLLSGTIVGDDRLYIAKQLSPVGDTQLSITNAGVEGFKVDSLVIGDTSNAKGLIKEVDNSKVVVEQGFTDFQVGETISTDPRSYSSFTGSPFTVNTGNLTELFLPQADLLPNTQYSARTRYATTNPSAAISNYSPFVSFTTAADFTIPAGTIIYGGGYAGQVLVGGTIYNIISWTRASENKALLWALTTSDLIPLYGTDDLEYGAPLTWANGNPTYPWFDYICNDPDGPNAGVVDATNTVGTGLNGYNDWYMAALYEGWSVFYYLKPTTNGNSILNLGRPGLTNGTGNNPIAVSPYQPNTTWTSVNPAQTPDPSWQTDGQYSYIQSNSSVLFAYLANLSSTDSNLYTINFSTALTSSVQSRNPYRAVVIRRQAA